MKQVRWYHHVLCALFGHHWRLFKGDGSRFSMSPIINDLNTCRRCLTPITETDEGILDG